MRPGHGGDVSYNNEVSVREEIEKQSLSYICVLRNSDSFSEGQMCYRIVLLHQQD